MWEVEAVMCSGTPFAHHPPISLSKEHHIVRSRSYPSGPVSVASGLGGCEGEVGLRPSCGVSRAEHK